MLLMLETMNFVMMLERVMSVVNVIGTKSMVMDYHKIERLSEKEFRQMYSELVNEYLDKRKLGNGNSPTCTRCKTDIPDRKSLRLYYESPFHSNCFGEMWRVERCRYNRGHVVKRFFDRVSRLELGA